MSNKARRMLVLLLIILKEAGPTAACSSSCSSLCYCDNRGLTSVPQDLPTDITYLDLEGNAIKTLNQSDFSSNNIHSIEAGTFNDTTKLRRLELQYNNISTITADIFGNLLQLQTLKLSGNNINTFPVEALLNLNMLSELTLDNNQLETLPFMAYDILASISTVNINDNPWQCDCRMAPFKQKMSGSYPFENQIRCDGPANLTGQYLRDVTLNPEDLICEETTPVCSCPSDCVCTNRGLSSVPQDLPTDITGLTWKGMPSQP
ncbi:hypothetical protein Bbelb_120320 [Branchiostoma belcheri]|nr:hypothetical protein Bbelb_120320 [Branchiostoma belcheri]